MQTTLSPTGTTVQPQQARPRTGVGFWTGRVLLGLVITLVALAATGASYQAVATAIDQGTYPAPGQLVDVGGYRLHINCMGQGSPTVILESGLANMSRVSAPTTALASLGATLARSRAIPGRSPVNCIPCSAGLASLARMCW